jgi:hypothetical protein
MYANRLERPNSLSRQGEGKPNARFAGTPSGTHPKGAIRRFQRASASLRKKAPSVSRETRGTTAAFYSANTGGTGKGNLLSAHSSYIPRKGERVEQTRCGVRRCGTVWYADGLQVLVKWDDGSSSSLRIGRDTFAINEPKERS